MSRKAELTADAGPRSRRSLLGGLTLRLHALADRLDRIPSGFGDETPVDETDPAALRREWRRQFDLWAGASPEQLFGFKAGALMLGGLLLLILVLIAAF